jgi:hypothetical protein
MPNRQLSIFLFGVYHDFHVISIATARIAAWVYLCCVVLMLYIDDTLAHLEFSCKCSCVGFPKGTVI